MGDRGSGRGTPSAAGLLACLVGGAMLVMQLAVFAAVALGVRDNQGTIYAFAIPFFTYLIGVPVGLAAAIAGRRRRTGNRSPSGLGLVLTLAGPILFVAMIAARSMFR